MIEREAKDALLRLCSQFPIVGVTGPRQSGKTTLCQSVFPEKRYVTMDNKSMRSIAEEDPTEFINAFPDGAIIDEAQKVPEIFDALKEHVDSTPYFPGKFILTGSSQFRLKENMTDSLAGRASFLQLLPFTIKELNNVGRISNDPYELILNGQYPPLYDNEKNYLKNDWYKSYIDTYVDLDVKDNINQSNVSTFKKLIQLCAHRSGELLSMDNLAHNLGVSQPTVKSWIHILERSYIIHLLQPDSTNLGRSLIKTPKLYFVDTGLLCYLLRIENKSDLLLSPYKGHVVEPFAVSELLKNKLNQGKDANLTFYRDAAGLEVDVVADWRQRYAIEIKSSFTTESKLAVGTKKYVGMSNEINSDPAQSVVFYLGDLTVNLNNTHYIGWKDWSDFCSK